MAKDLDSSTKTLGTFFCFVLIAYIFYTLGSWSSQRSSQVTPPSCNRQCCKQGEATIPKEADQPEPETEKTPKKSSEEKVYKELTQSAKWYDTFATNALNEARRCDKEMRRDLEKWNEERRLEMKVFREEQLRWLWESKRKEEKSGWFGAVRRKK